MRCRPELAPGLASASDPGNLAWRAAALIDGEIAPDLSVPRLAAALGVSERHLRRVFQMEFGVSPVQYLQTRRLLLAKSLLTDTRLPITQVAFAAGFKSVRRFNELFRGQYRLAPRDLRKTARSSLSQGQGITVQLGYRPPFDWDALVTFLAGRTIAGVEQVVDGVYSRSVRIGGGCADTGAEFFGAGTSGKSGGAPASGSGGFGGADTLVDKSAPATPAPATSAPAGEHIGWISVAPVKAKAALALTLSESLLPVLPRLIARVRLLFDLDADPAAISAVLRAMDDFCPGLHRAGTRLPGCFDSWEMAVRAVLGQQITVKAAQTLARRVAEQLGTPLQTPFAEVNRLFPTAAELLRLPGRIEDRLGSLGVTGARSRCIAALAQALQSDPQLLSPQADAPEQMRRLLELRGFGPWTVNYLAMRALSWPDAFPHTDYGVKKALEPLAEKEILALAEKWRPWRSYATIDLWNSLAEVEQ
jgi:AraC family transcriptional regulator of adaptative response / DNA-3-methyladenine glycosylase II